MPMSSHQTKGPVFLRYLRISSIISSSLKVINIRCPMGSGWFSFISTVHECPLLVGNQYRVPRPYQAIICHVLENLDFFGKHHNIMFEFITSNQNYPSYRISTGSPMTVKCHYSAHRTSKTLTRNSSIFKTTTNYDSLQSLLSTSRVSNTQINPLESLIFIWNQKKTLILKELPQSLPCS